MSLHSKSELYMCAVKYFFLSCPVVYLAACGETLNIDFILPFNEFVPTTCNMRFCLRVSTGRERGGVGPGGDGWGRTRPGPPLAD